GREGRVRRGRRRIRLPHRRRAGRQQGAPDPAAGRRGADRALRGLRAANDEAPARGGGVRTGAGRQGRAGTAAHRRVRAAVKVAFAVCTVLAVTFLTLPVVAIFLRVSPGTLVRELGDPVARDALVVSLRTSAVAQALVVVCGTPTAYLLASRRSRGRNVLLTLVELPLVLPPAVA